MATEAEQQWQSEDSELPAPPANTAGQSTSTSGRHNIEVSNAHGYLCHISTHGEHDCPPALIFALFTNPNNTGIFRDIKAVTSRTVLSEDPAGLKVVEVEQLGEVRILWHTVQFRTLLKVTEDSRDAEHLTTHFELIRSDVLGKFNGVWHLQPIRKDGGQEVVGTSLKLEQDVTPRGVPAFLKHMPVLGHVLRGICVRAVKRLLEDISAAVARVEAGQPWEEVVQPAPAPVLSHMIKDLENSDSDDNSPAAQSPPAQHMQQQPGPSDEQHTSPKLASLEQHGQNSDQAEGGFWDTQSWLPK